MIDLKFLLQNPGLVRQNNLNRGVPADVDAVLKLAEERLAEIAATDEIRAAMNKNAAASAGADAATREPLVAEGRSLKEKLKEKQARLSEVEEELERLLRSFPNILRDDVPVAGDESGNEVLREVGDKPSFAFKPKDHMELGEAMGLIDVERAAKVSGSRFVYLKGDAVLLEFALVQYALSVLVAEGFTPVVPPHIISTGAMGAMGYLEHGGEDEIYHLKNDDAVLIGTSEQAMGPMHMDEILPADKLPMRYVGISPCYRREAGSHGKDVRGILRMHQFDKIEMFSFAAPETSDAEHEVLLAMQERLMQGLKLPYRVLKLCSGDTGAPSARTYDIETWIPSQNTYRETHSTSNTTDFQTRRLKTRYKTPGGKNELVHALNGTAFAIGRTLIAILENYQQADGSIVIPEILRPWVGKDKIA